MGILGQVKGRIEYGTQKAREGYGAYLSKRVDDKPVSTKKAVQEIRTGYLQYVHNPVMGSFTGRTVKTKSAVTSKQQHNQQLAILKQKEKMMKLHQKAVEKGIDVSYEGKRFGNYEMNFTGQKPEALRSTGYNINDMFK